jgi:hypothetical protein
MVMMTETRRGQSSRTMQSEPSRMRCSHSCARTRRTPGAYAYYGFARTEYARRIISDAVEAVVRVDVEEDVVDADEDEASIRACQARGRIGDESTRRCCQHRACIERDQYELCAMSRD